MKKGHAGAGILAVLIVVGLAVGTYYWLYAPPSKDKMCSYLVQFNYSQGTPAQLMAFGTDYITAWYTAAKAAQSTFILNGKTYNTQGGTAVTS